MPLRCAVTAIAIVCLLFLFAVHPPLSNAADLALVYSGPGSAEDCPEALGKVIESIGLEVRYFEDPEELTGLLGAAVLLAVGGTDDNTLRLRKSFSEETVQAIQRFAATGGRYCGICGGSYLASAFWRENGLVHGFSLAPVAPDNFLDDPSPMLLPILWQKETREMYYQLGPYFELLETDEPVEVLAWYEDGSVAALICGYNQGKVLLSGPHPEAPRYWIEDDGLPVGGWQSSIGRLQAALQDLLSDRPLICN